MVLALVSTNVFAGELMPQQSGVPMTDPQGFPGEPQQFAPNMVAPQGDPNFVAPQHPPVGVPHTPQFINPNQVPLGAPIGSPNAPLHPQVPHVSGAPTPCTPGVAPVPQQGIVPQS